MTPDHTNKQQSEDAKAEKKLTVQQLFRKKKPSINAKKGQRMNKSEVKGHTCNMGANTSTHQLSRNAQSGCQTNSSTGGEWPVPSVEHMCLQYTMQLTVNEVSMNVWQRKKKQSSWDKNRHNSKTYKG